MTSECIFQLKYYTVYSGGRSTRILYLDKSTNTPIQVKAFKLGFK